MIIMDSFLGQHNPSNYFALTAYIVSLLFSIELFGVTYEKEMDILFIIIVSA